MCSHYIPSIAYNLQTCKHFAKMLSPPMVSYFQSLLPSYGQSAASISNKRCLHFFRDDTNYVHVGSYMVQAMGSQLQASTTIKRCCPMTYRDDDTAWINYVHVGGYMVQSIPNQTLVSCPQPTLLFGGCPFLYYMYQHMQYVLHKDTTMFPCIRGGTAISKVVRLVLSQYSTLKGLEYKSTLRRDLYTQAYT